jgi:DNA-binding LytR/AlgR family response regulator
MKIKCLVVDDEPLAQRVLEKYIVSLPSLELVKKCSNAIEASSYLHQHPVDVIFLDIKMPELNGMEFLETLSQPPQIILTTAYSEYALEGYEYSVLDYLLKPISFERFLKAVNKIKKSIPEKTKEMDALKTEEDFIFLKTDQTHHRVKYQDIKYVQGYGNYVKVFTEEKRILISETMSRLETILPQNLFVRIHKSYIVSLRKIEKIRENKIRINDITIPIGRAYKLKVNDILKKFKLSSRK